MPVRITERPKQAAEIQFGKPKIKREYTCSGSLDRLDIQLAVAGYSPAIDQSIDGSTGAAIFVFRNRISIDECGGGVWYATVDYESTPDTVELSVTFGVASGKVYQALADVASFSATSSASAATITASNTASTAAGTAGSDANAVGPAIIATSTAYQTAFNAANVVGVSAPVRALCITANSATFTTPVFAYVQRVYPYCNFGVFQL